MDATAPEFADLAEYLPEELLTATVQEAEEDAVRVAQFLQVFCERIDRDHPGCGLRENWRRLFSPHFLLELGGALRLLAWEEAGNVQRHMNLPAAQPKLREVLLAAGNRSGEPALSRLVVQTFAEHFAWNARSDLGAPISLGPIDEEVLAESLAQFLWTHRHVGEE